MDPEGLVRCQAVGGAPALLTVVDLDAVTRARTHGTCGLNRMWSQMRPGDPVVPVPLYSGRLDPARWEPGTARTNGDTDEG